MVRFHGCAGEGEEPVDKILLMFLFVIAPIYVLGQDDRVSDAENVRSVVRELATRSAKATILSRKLVAYSGKVVAADQHSFDLKIKKNTSTLKYEDVLELSTGGRDFSFVPDVTKRGHGLWQDINIVYPGTRIVVVLVNGKSVKGFSNSATATSLLIIERERHERMEIRRDQVTAFYGLVGGYGGVKKNASKGAEAMHTGRDKLLGGVFAGVGALVGLVKSDGRPILIYSR